MRILCASDLQIGAGRTLGITLEDQERWLQQIVGLAEGADLLLFLGDAFENRVTNRDQDEVFMRFLVEAARECPVLLVGGNHDWRGYERASTVGIFREIGVTVALEPGHHWFALPDESVVIAALPWASLGHLVASQNGGDRAAQYAEASAHLATIAQGLRDQIGPGQTTILAAHWAVSGASLPTGLPVDLLGEPVIEISDLAAQRWDAIALGHVHRAQLFNDDPPAFYCGSPYPCTWGEADDEHGVWLLEPDPATRNERERAIYVPRFVPLEGPRLVKICMDAEDVLEVLASEWPLSRPIDDAIVRVTVSATAEQARQIDIGLLRREAMAAGARHVVVQLDVEQAERARVEGMSEELDELEALALWCDAQGIDGPRAERLRARTEKYLAEIRP